MKKLPKKFKQRWVNALRSGKYMQGAYRLKTSSNHYCCLGVAADICKISDRVLKKKTMLDLKMLSKVKVPSYKSGFKILTNNKAAINKLIDMNDNKYRSFKYIAAYIERYL